MLSLRKSVHPYDYMNDWERFNEIAVPEKEHYAHAKRVYKDFGIKNLRESHDLHLKRDVLRLADVFENF